MREEIEQEYTSKIMTLNKEDPTYQARKEYFENKRVEHLDAINAFEYSLKKSGKKTKFQDIDAKIEGAINSRRVKMILEFNN